jgi:hypothetical protein
LAFRQFLTNLEQRNFFDEIFPPMNSEFKLLDKLGRSFFVRMERLRNSRINSRINNNNRGPSSNVGDHFFLNFTSRI